MRLQTLLVACLFIGICYGQTICASGRTPSNIGLNGEYTQISIYNSFPAYIKTQPLDCFPPGTTYLFVGGDNKYYFSTNIGNTSSTFGRCNQADLSLPTACNQWIIGTGNTVDSSFSFDSGECPKSTCGSIKIVSSNGSPPCSGDLTSYDVNTYSTGGGFYFNFNTYWQRWQCVDINNIDICGITVYGYANSRQWISISPGVITTIDYTYFDSSLNPVSTQFDVECIASDAPTSVTATPTRNPVKAATTDNICLFGHTGAFTFVNGFYEYTNAGNSVYYVKNNADSNCGEGTSIYMYFTNSKWYISKTIGSTDSSIYGVCNSAVVFENPIDCNGLWQFAGGDSPNAIITAGSCPTTGCPNGIDTTNTGTIGPFTEQITQNDANGRTYIAVYRNPSNNYYLFFNEDNFRWEYAINFQGVKTCAQTSFHAQTRGWFDFTNDETQSIQWTNGQSTSIVCYDGTNGPTKAPIISPSQSPVGTPSTSPIQMGSPTRSPIKPPTMTPTMNIITNSPSKGTTAPSDYVPGTPSVAPSVPSVSPTKSTTEPTNNPIIPSDQNTSDTNPSYMNAFLISLIFLFILFV